MKHLSITILILSMALAMACNKSSKEVPGTTSGTTQSAPASTQSSKASPVPAPNFTPATPIVAGESATAPGMNPPHGQPNHRCDIPVGAPLNSPAVKPK